MSTVSTNEKWKLKGIILVPSKYIIWTYIWKITGYTTKQGALTRYMCVT